MTRRTVLVVVVAVLISVVTAGTAIAAQPGAIGLAPASATQTAGPGELPENATNATDGLPAGVANFTNTTALGGTQVEPPSLAGKLRVESAYAANTSVELVRNSSTNFTLNVTVTGDAENVSFYLQETAFAASQNLSNVTAELDGEPLAIGTTEANDSSWIGFEIDHFSTRTVTFDTAAPNGSDAANATGPPALPGQANAPIDTDGDGLYEDVTGDDEFSVLDVAVFLQNFDGETVTQNPASFDFNGDGDVSIIDVAALLDQLA